MNKRIKMTVELDVTIPQAVALKAMFDHWNYLSSIGSTKSISFLVDGGGNFHPNATCTTSEEIPELTKAMEKLICIDGDVTLPKKDDLIFDFDQLDLYLNSQEK